MVCNVNIVFRKLKSENSPDYARNLIKIVRFMNLASVPFCSILYPWWGLTQNLPYIFLTRKDIARGPEFFAVVVLLGSYLPLSLSTGGKKKVASHNGHDWEGRGRVILQHKKTVGLYIYSTYLPKNCAESWQLGFFIILSWLKILLFSVHLLRVKENHYWMMNTLFLLDEAIIQYIFR